MTGTELEQLLKRNTEHRTLRAMLRALRPNRAVRISDDATNIVLPSIYALHMPGYVRSTGNAFIYVATPLPEDAAIRTNKDVCALIETPVDQAAMILITSSHGAALSRHAARDLTALVPEDYQ